MNIRSFICSNEKESDNARHAIMVKVGVCSFFHEDMMITVAMFPMTPRMKIRRAITLNGSVREGVSRIWLMNVKFSQINEGPADGIDEFFILPGSKI